MLKHRSERKDTSIERRLMSLTSRHQAKVKKLESELTPEFKPTINKKSKKITWGRKGKMIDN